MKLVPLLEAGYASVKGGLSDEEMIRKFFVNDEQLATDLGDFGRLGDIPVVKAFRPAKGLTALYQYNYPHPVKFILLLGDGTWSVELEEDGGETHVEGLDGIQLYSLVYAQ